MSRAATVLYILVGIGILVEVIRRLGAAFVAIRTETSRNLQRGPAARVDRSPHEP